MKDILTLCAELAAPAGCAGAGSVCTSAAVHANPTTTARRANCNAITLLPFKRLKYAYNLTIHLMKSGLRGLKPFVTETLLVLPTSKKFWR